jgi:hypothetical protein
VEGADDEVITADTAWKEYQFKSKPDDLSYRPPQIAPYHLRLDWLMWFAAMSSYQDYPWFVNLLAKLLQGDRQVLGLLRINPFERKPPRFIRAVRYLYQFTTPAEHKQTDLWWRRTSSATYFPVVSLETPAFRQMLQSQGWLGL